MTVTMKSIEDSVRMLVGLGDYAGAAEAAKANIPREEMHMTRRRDAFRGIAHAAIVDGALPAAIELLLKHGEELDDDTIVAIVDRVSTDAPELIDALHAAMKAHEDGPTVPLPRRPEPIVIDDLPAAARTYED